MALSGSSASAGWAPSRSTPVSCTSTTTTPTGSSTTSTGATNPDECQRPVPMRAMRRYWIHSNVVEPRNYAAPRISLRGTDRNDDRVRARGERGRSSARAGVIGPSYLEAPAPLGNHGASAARAHAEADRLAHRRRRHIPPDGGSLPWAAPPRGAHAWRDSSERDVG